MSDKKSDGAICWSHPALDDVCRKLPQFGACIIILEEDEDAEFVWKQADLLVRNANEKLLKSLRSRWDSQTRIELSEQVRRDRIDLLVLQYNGRNPSELAQACRDVAALPCAMIFLARDLPADWEKFFDISLKISNERALVVQNGSTTPSFEMDCKLNLTRARVRAQGAPVPSKPAEARVAPPPSPPIPNVPTGIRRIAVFGVNPTLKRELQAALAKEDALEIFEISKKDLKTLPPISTLVVGAPLENKGMSDLLQELTLEQRKIGVSLRWIALGSALHRDQDRTRMYEAGAATVLPREATTEEFIAAVKSSLPGFKPKFNSSSNWEREIDELLSEVPRIGLWKSDQLGEAVAAYEPIVLCQLQHAEAIGTQAGALIIELPNLPKEFTDTGWSKLLQGALLELLASGLRSQDLSFMVGSHMSVLSHQMNPLSARAVVRRIQELMPNTSLTNTWKIIEPNDITPEVAQSKPAALIQSIFTQINGRKT